MKNSFIMRYLRKSLVSRFIFPTILIILTIVIFQSVPFTNHFHPDVLTQHDNLEYHYTEENPFVSVTVDELYYSGFDYVRNGKIAGHYYYTLINNFCRFYLLKNTSDNPTSSILRNQTITGTLLQLDQTLFDDLITNVAQELEWTASGLKELSDPYIISTITDYDWKHIVLLSILILCFLVSGSDLILSTIYLLYPSLAPGLIHLNQSGSTLTALTQAEAQVRDFCIVKTENMYLTPNYIINLDSIRTAVLPLEQIVWIYAHGHMSHFLWIKLRFSYTLHITLNNGRSYEFISKELEELEFVMKAIKEYYPDLIYGYSSENKRMAKTFYTKR